MCSYIIKFEVRHLRRVTEQEGQAEEGEGREREGEGRGR